MLIQWTAWRDRTIADQMLITGITRSRLSGGKIVESWTQWDRTHELREFGRIQPD